MMRCLEVAKGCIENQVASCCRLVGMNFSTHDLKYGSHPRSGGSKYTSIRSFGAKTPEKYDKYVI